jgi:translation initiation factor IF-2
MAGRVKVIELAKELGVTSKDLLVALEGMGLKGKRTATPLEEPLARQLRAQFGRGRKFASEPKASKAAKETAARAVAAPKKKAPVEKMVVVKKPMVAAAPVVEAREVAAVKPVEAKPPEVRVPEPAPPKVERKAERKPAVKAIKPEGKVAPPPPKPQPIERAPAPPPAPPAPPRVVPLPPAVKKVPAPAAARPAPLRPAAPAPPQKVVAAPPPAPVVEPRPVAPPPPPPVIAPPPPPIPEVLPPPQPPVEVKRELIRLPESVTVGELASSMRRKSVEVIKALLEMGVMATLNEILDPTAAKLAADKFGFDVEVRSLEGEELLEEEVDSSQLRLRPPVVTVMGHVDHGKTSLLDAIRRTKVVEKEFGGITQHIGAYQVETTHGNVTFLDTPGHEAFTAMRARGAQATDIVILVVAADDGVMPQTVEAVDHAKAANVPIIAAVNKIDKPGADPEKVKRELSNLGLVPEEWGGQTIFVPTSAKQGTGIDSLLEMTALQAEILELKANPNRAAKGVIVEAKLDRGRGAVATVLIRNGTLREGDAVVVGQHYGRVRAMFSDRGKKLREAGPSDPVEILGLSGVPLAGDTLVAVGDERKARQIATVRQDRERQKAKGTVRVTLEDLHKRVAAGEVKELRLILKADVHGSVEALTESLERLSTEEVKLKVIHGSVGAITETDIMLASASNAIVLGFNVKPESKAAARAQAEGVDVRTYNVIYEAINDVRAALSGLLAPEIREISLGKAQVRALFSLSKAGTVLGSYVLEGKIVRNAKARVRRETTLLGEGVIASLKRFKDDVREVLQGLECGIGVEGVSGVQVGDVIEAYTTEEVARTL